MAALLLTTAVGAQSLTLSLEAATHPQFALAGLRLHLANLGDGPALLAIDRLQVAGKDLGPVELRCANLQLALGRIECPHADLVRGNRPAMPARFSYHSPSGDWEVEVTPQRGERWRLSRSGEALEARLDNGRLERVTPLVPLLAQYHGAGSVSGRARLDGPTGAARLTFDIDLRELAFHDDAGDHAGEKLSGTLKGGGRQARGEWRWQAEATWDAGEVFFKPFYFARGGHRLQAAGRGDERGVSVESATLEVARVGTMQASAEWDRKTGSLRKAHFATGELQLAEVGQLLLRPLLEQHVLPSVDLNGHGRVAGDWDGQGLSRLDVHLDQVSATTTRGTRLEAISADLPWRRDAASRGQIHVAGGALGAVPLGAFDLPLEMHGLDFELPRAQIPVLDGSIVIDGARLARSGGEWQWQVGASLYPVSLEALTAALGLPRMKGTVSASIPRVAHERGSITMDGTMIVQVFDGYIGVNHLRVIEPFGRVPRLYADLDMRHLDLGQLTETFSFGSITGFVDGAVSGLELIGWKPQRFDAHIESSPGRYSKRISQRAVENISALGGASASAAIQRSVLRFFDEFGYSRIGLSCRLAGGVCRMDGIEPAPQGYVIVKGGGVPAINVIGYNRNVDWEELISRLQRITAGAKPVIE